jgi:hypothetical protein
MLCLSATLSHKSRAAAAPEILSQQLTSPTASKKVEAVLWTRRPDRYTLQVVFPNIGRLLAIGDSLKTPEVALWLLRSDGTTVVATRQVVPEQKNGARPTEIVYTVPLSTGEEAVAAAFRIEDNYYIEPLRPLKGK